MAAFRGAYTRLRASMQARPILALSITNGVLAGVSDVLAQRIAHPSTDTSESVAITTVADTGVELARPPSKTDAAADTDSDQAALNLTRTTRFAVYGVAIAPVVHHWYALLDRSFPLPTGQGTSGGRQLSTRMLGQVAKRVAGDQFLFAPVGIAVFFSLMTLFEGGTVQDIKQKLNSSYLSALMANYMIWPAVQFVNFCYVPLLLRVPFVSGVSVFWNTYLSYLNSQRHGQADAAIDN